jgi:hypothetical protein
MANQQIEPMGELRPPTPELQKEQRAVVVRVKHVRD